MVLKASAACLHNIAYVMQLDADNVSMQDRFRYVQKKVHDARILGLTDDVLGSLGAMKRLRAAQLACDEQYRRKYESSAANG